jgi:hypothetical protein
MGQRAMAKNMHLLLSDDGEARGSTVDAWRDDLNKG